MVRSSVGLLRGARSPGRRSAGTPSARNSSSLVNPLAPACSARRNATAAESSASDPARCSRPRRGIDSRRATDCNPGRRTCGISRDASPSVSILGFCHGSRPQRRSSAFTNEMSKSTLWPTSTASPTNVSSRDAIRSNGGAPSNCSSRMPVSSAMNFGTARPGLTSVSNRSISTPASNRIAATSITRCVAGRNPVVSTSIATNRSSSRCRVEVASDGTTHEPSERSTRRSWLASIVRSNDCQSEAPPLPPKTKPISASSVTTPPLARTNVSARSTKWTYWPPAGDAASDPLSGGEPESLMGGLVGAGHRAVGGESRAVRTMSRGTIVPVRTL